MAYSILNQAIEKYKKSHNGVEVTIHQMPIPGFWGTLGDTVLNAAAERAVTKGWADVILTWEDMPCGVCFEDGYCFVVAIDQETAEKNGGTHYFEQKDFLCEMDRNGEIYKEQPDSRDDTDDNPFAGDFSSYEGPYAV